MGRHTKKITVFYLRLSLSSCVSDCFRFSSQISQWKIINISRVCANRIGARKKIIKCWVDGNDDDGTTEYFFCVFLSFVRVESNWNTKEMNETVESDRANIQPFLCGCCCYYVFFSLFFFFFSSFQFIRFVCFSLARNIFLLSCWLHFWCERRRIVRRTYSMCFTHIEWLAHRMSRRVCVCMRLWPCYCLYNLLTTSKFASQQRYSQIQNSVLYINLSKKWLSICVVAVFFIHRSKVVFKMISFFYSTDGKKSVRTQRNCRWTVSKNKSSVFDFSVCLFFSFSHLILRITSMCVFNDQVLFLVYLLIIQIRIIIVVIAGRASGAPFLILWWIVFFHLRSITFSFSRSCAQWISLKL